jgi:hypothetical protein
MHAGAQYIAPLRLWDKHDDQDQPQSHQNPLPNDFQSLHSDLLQFFLIFDLFCFTCCEA